MKKYLSLAILATIAIAGGCTKELYGPAPESEAKVEAKGISVRVSEVKDSSFVVSLTPEDTSAVYYSYAVVEGALSAVDSSSLYSGGYKAAAVAYGVIKNVSPYTSSVAVGGLTPNTAYTVYAVSSSSTGVPGSVSSVSVTTSDNLAPYIVDYDYKENVVTVQFSESVSFVEGSSVSVSYYASYLLNHNYFDPYGEAEAQVEVDGDAVSFTLSGVPVGAYYTVSFPEGAFTDAAGNKAEALESYFYKTEAGGAGAVGLYGRVSTADFELDAGELTTVADLSDGFVISVPEGVKIALYDSSVPASLSISLSDQVHTYAPEDASELLEWDGTALTVSPSYLKKVSPTRGSKISVNVPRGLILDIYGNRNAALTVGPVLYSYGFTLADVIGEYYNSGQSAYGEDYNEDPWTLTIAESDDESKGNVLISSYYGFETKIYGNFDADKGELSFPIYYEEIGSKTESEIEYIYTTFAYNSCYKNEKTELTIYFNGAHSIAGLNDYPGYYWEAYKTCDYENPVNYDYNVFVPYFQYQTSAGASLWAPSYEHKTVDIKR